jgi:hypothetical protein
MIRSDRFSYFLPAPPASPHCVTKNAKFFQNLFEDQWQPPASAQAVGGWQQFPAL